MSRTRTRVLQVLWRLSTGGGVPMVVRGVAQHSDPAQLELHLCTIRPLLDEERLTVGDSVAYHPIGLVGDAGAGLRARAVAGIARVVRRVRPDVLHVHSGTAWYSAAGAMLAPRARKIIEVHDAPQSERLSRANRRLERSMQRRLGFSPVVHSSAVRQGVASAWDLSAEDIPLVPLGIDLDAFSSPERSRAEVRADLGLPADVPLVLYVARLVAEKRPELFLEVAKLVRDRRPDAVFVLGGGGGGLERLRERVRSSGMDGWVMLPGFVDDLPSLYHSADLFLSTSRYEGFGLAIAEAMASGLPVVSTRVGGVEDVIGDAGVLAGSSQPDDLAQAVADLLEDPDHRRQLGARAQARALEVLDVRATALAFAKLYQGSA